MAGFLDWRPPSFTPFSVPVLPSLGLSEDERQLVAILQNRAQHDVSNMRLSRSYYKGAQAIDNLKMAVPDEVAQTLRTIVGWPRLAVNPYVERLAADGFRLPGETDVNQDLQDICTDNGLAAEQKLSYKDALSMGRSYWLVGSPDEPGGSPRITVESPLNMGVLWDLSGRHAEAAIQAYMVDQQQHAAIYTPEQTFYIAQDERYVWRLVDRDVHGFGYVPVERMAYDPDTDNRDGNSAITPELMSTVDGACRTLLGLEVARELYSAPRIAVIGAALESFQNADGTKRSQWDTYIHKLLGLERDENGDLPTIHQLSTYDPAVFTKLVEMYGSQAAGITAAQPQELGLYTQGNPVSAESYDAADLTRNRRAELMQDYFATPLIRVMQMAVRFQNNGDLPEKFRRIEVDWRAVHHTSLAQAADPISKMIAAGSFPATSDVTLKLAGVSAVQRQQMAQDREAGQGQSALQEIALSLAAKATRADATQAPGQPDPSAPAPTPNVMPKRAPVSVPANA
jgi:hypothetical protein